MQNARQARAFVRRVSGSGFDRVFAQGNLEQVGHGVGVELFHDVGAVRLHRLDADAQVVGNLLVQPAGDHQLEDLPLARAELGETVKLVVFGHMGDGNLHILLGAQPFDAAMKHRIEDLVFTPLQALGGSISAEHGIGRLKRDELAHYRSPTEIDLMRAIKAAFDPTGYLNPAVLFD